MSDEKSAPKNRRRGRPPVGGAAEIPRDHLLQAALRAFAEAGYEGMSMRSLAEQLGISHGLLNLRFGTKQQLWEASIEYGLEKFRKRMIDLPREGTLEGRFKAAVVQVLEAIRAVPEMLRILNQEGTVQSARLDHIAETILADRYSRLEEVIAEGAQAGILQETPAQLITVMVAHGGGVLFGLKPLALKLGLLETGDDQELDSRALQIADIVWRAVQRPSAETAGS
ncbi:TetR/AcrR family transcriptional regulator [Sphingobium phenoxybenzoativorans]|uniref:TetR/AcrR family transcriptional regulator n=1 Tax=Sphingobium phenoxybenzoativorans TaxID=1592790 RepID=UPI0008725E2B|nr:TetR/AcrR family transcriptional regulator [Sphingobium phenoxybenzoativorans]